MILSLQVEIPNTNNRLCKEGRQLKGEMAFTHKGRGRECERAIKGSKGSLSPDKATDCIPSF